MRISGFENFSTTTVVMAARKCFYSLIPLCGWASDAHLTANPPAIDKRISRRIDKLPNCRFSSTFTCRWESVNLQHGGGEHFGRKHSPVFAGVFLHLADLDICLTLEWKLRANVLVRDLTIYCVNVFICHAVGTQIRHLTGHFSNNNTRKNARSGRWSQNAVKSKKSDNTALVLISFDAKFYSSINGTKIHFNLTHVEIWCASPKHRFC